MVLTGIETLEVESGVVRSHLSDVLNNDDKIYRWSAEQTYIAAANMMSVLPLSRLILVLVKKVLELDTSKFQVAMMLPFGYRINEQSKQLRSDFQSLVEFIN